ncbi:hypothetical protein FOZ63_009076, partial [Perkinsus olseni]
GGKGVVCYNCGKTGHIAPNCPEAKKAGAAAQEDKSGPPISDSKILKSIDDRLSMIQTEIKKPILNSSSSDSDASTVCSDSEIESSPRSKPREVAPPSTSTAEDRLLEDNELYSVYYRAAGHYEVVAKRTPAPQSPDVRQRQWRPMRLNDLVDEAYKDMREYEAVTPWNNDVPVAATRLFVVETGHRDRGVVDLRDYNAECGGSIPEPASIREVMSALRNKGHYSVGQLDLTRAYYSIHFTVAEGAAYPAFYYRDKVYRFTRLPMGWVHSSRVLGICVRDLLDSTPVKEGCIRRVYADNLCYSSPSDELTRAAMQSDRDALNSKGFLIKDEAFEVLDTLSSIKMLGYVVYREDDVTRLKCKERSLPLVTNRRSLLSIAGKAYDELGIIGAGAYKGALCSMAGTGVTPDRKRESMTWPVVGSMYTTAVKIRSALEKTANKSVVWAPPADAKVKLYTDAS